MFFQHSRLVRKRRVCRRAPFSTRPATFWTAPAVSDKNTLRSRRSPFALEDRLQAMKEQFRPFKRLLYLALTTTEPEGGGDLVRLEALRDDEQTSGAALFSTAARPRKRLSPAQTRRSGLTNAVLDDLPDLDEALDDLHGFAVGCEVWVTAGGEEARSALAGAARRCGFPLDRDAPLGAPLLGTDEIAALVFPERLRPTPAELAREYGIEVAESRREGKEAALLREVWRRLLDDVGKLPAPLTAEMNWLTANDSSPTAVLLREAEKWAVRERFDEAFSKQKVSLESLFAEHGEVLKRLVPCGEGNGDDDGEAGETADEAEFYTEEELAEKQRAAEEAGEEAVRLLGPDGPLAAHLPGYEERPEQLEMARRAAACLTVGRHLLVEAGTGVGKSLAYLVPALLFAKTSGRPVVVSTHTKNLQAQLFRKDLPFLQEHLGVPFEAALVKGRGNYLCLRKLFYVLREAARELDEEERSALLPLLSWAVRTPSGDVEEAASFPRERRWELWDRLHTVGEDCLGRRCKQYKRCFLYKARALARGAEVVVANHALVFAELGGGGGGALPPHREIVFDEAHTLEDVAVGYLACEVTPRRVRRILHRLFHAADARRGGKGLLPELLFKLDAARADFPPPLYDSIRDNLLRAVQAVAPAEMGAEQLFQAAAEFLAAGTDSCGRGARRRFSADKLREGEKEFLQVAKETAVAGLGRLRQATDQVLRDCREMRARNIEGVWETEKESSAQHQFLIELIHDVEFILVAEEPDYVYWVEQTGGRVPRRPGRGRRRRGGAASAFTGGGSFRWVAAPLDVAGLLHDQLFGRKRAVVLTSATLSVRDADAAADSGLRPAAGIGRAVEDFLSAARLQNNVAGRRDNGRVEESTAESKRRKNDKLAHPKAFEFVKRRLGLTLGGGERLEELLLGSPFDYRRQCRLLVPTFLSEPGRRRSYDRVKESEEEVTGARAGYENELDELLAEAIIAAAGRTMVLYTSHAALLSAAKALRPRLAADDIELLVQGVGGPRELLLEKFSRDTRTALLGTASFWEGVDVRGAALSLLVVAKLPFAVFTEPLIEARCERLEAEGKDPFLHYSVPTAILRLRQGFGRLIRSKEDRGVAILADKRVLTKRYGAAFLRALPAVARAVNEPAVLPEKIRSFLAEPPARGSTSETDCAAAGPADNSVPAQRNR